MKRGGCIKIISYLINDHSVHRFKTDNVRKNKRLIHVLYIWWRYIFFKDLTFSHLIISTKICIVSPKIVWNRILLSHKIGIIYTTLNMKFSLIHYRTFCSRLGRSKSKLSFMVFEYFTWFIIFYLAPMPGLCCLNIVQGKGFICLILMVIFIASEYQINIITVTIWWLIMLQSDDQCFKIN